ncbi:MAG: pyridine nucleotide-disulfide oxidoreductase [Chloroflexi bacterium]|nr:MAG: pyridine nucleotide-disulfide oxidoreductase [Chloroflexota bacterium]
MDRFDIAVIGAGAAGEAATHLAAGRGARVVVVDRELFGGACPFWACMPSKALLHAAAVHHAGGAYEWRRASDFRDYMINRERTDWPDDGGHVRALEGAGATVVRGSARFIGPGLLEARHEETVHRLEADKVILAIGSVPRIPSIPGLDRVEYWTNREGTATRDLPRSLLIMGGGPTGVELAQVYARYGVPTTLIDSNPRINSRDHPRSSEILAAALERDGVTIRTGVRAQRVRPAAGEEADHALELSDGSSVEGQRILVAIGRSLPLDGMELAAIGVTPRDGRLDVDDRLRVADNVFAAGDVAGPELHTHLAHYEGELAARLALGDDVTPDLRAIPRATYTDPETASVGLQLEQARARGMDAIELTEDLATTAKGYVSEAQGHVSIVIDRRSRTLAGAFMAGPGVSEAIHEAVLALKLGTPMEVLADTIHAFPTVARVLGSLFTRAEREIAAGSGQG